MLNPTPLAVVVLAAGKGTRMNSSMPKVMHNVLGLPMVNWILRTVEALSPEHIIVVAGQGMPDLIKASEPHQSVIQETQDGTGSALKSALSALDNFTGDILVLLGDTPLISEKTLRALIAARHYDGETGLSVLGARFDNPTGYGRLLTDSDGSTLLDIREEKDARADEKLVNIVNTGAFCLDGSRLSLWVEQLNNNNAQGEYYITDLPKIAAQDGVKTRISIVSDCGEVQGCNTRLDLNRIEQSARKTLCENLILQGVHIHDPSTTYLHYDTKIAAGSIIEPNVFFGAGVVIESNVHIKAFSHIEETQIGQDSIVGPFARLRPGSDIGKDVRIGNFVEIKKSSIGDRSKISHLGYVGDCIMGDDVNFSCGAITVNYDGFQKYQTVIGKGVMVGSNVNLVAPLKLEDGAFIAAGSTITSDVPADALSMTRPETQTREGWAAIYRKRKNRQHNQD